MSQLVSEKNLQKNLKERHYKRRKWDILNLKGRNFCRKIVS